MIKFLYKKEDMEPQDLKATNSKRFETETLNGKTVNTESLFAKDDFGLNEGIYRI
jgi:hypothetical protein